MIGDLETIALRRRRGGRNRLLCFPHFDSPTVFTALLDTREGGTG